ncbi:MAG: hypothetical protein O9267_09195 [Flavobacterium sp.]|uniref:hypothetical protein n=1 Tax=Flavobacterium sp. TaxID=239 RepID=UPI0022CB2A45|nr:hypothetical protein [Flavobacterium sp.]MCZ8197769.1 hypothetical protein [Flavobacterium sp.]
MTSKKKYLVGFIVVFSLFSIWYLFVKESDYIINFKAQTSTGTIFQGIQEWSKQRAVKENEVYTTLEKRNFDFIFQEVKKGNESYQYSWEMTSVNDSTTAVSVAIKDLNNSIYNKLTAPFFPTKFKEEQIKKITEFRDGLKEHLSALKVKIEGEGSSEETFIAYINLKSVLQEKAQTMITNDAKITGYLQENKIKIIGKPYLEVINWDLDAEKLDFNYCFPIDKNTQYIPDANVKFKMLPAVKGLKATYYGNMRTSDRAWFALLDYAKKNNLKLNNKPLEHFFANPFNGGNELEWETQIVIPFDKK